MSLLHRHIVKSLLGTVYDKLEKSIVKEDTNSVVDISELHDAFNLAPKSLVAWLMTNIAPLNVNDGKIIDVPWEKNSQLLVNKKSEDVYSGYITKDGQKAHEFHNCSIPKLAAHLLSFYELYDEAILEHKTKAKEKSEMAVPIKDKKEDENNESEKKNNLSDKIKSLELKNDNKNSDFASVISLLEKQIDAIIAITTKLHKSDNCAERFNKNKHEKDVKIKLKQFIDVIKRLKLYRSDQFSMKMPAPPRPGTKVGGQRGITRAGKHGYKTPFSDFNPSGGQTQTRLFHYLKSGERLAEMFHLPKQPKQPKQPKFSLFLKSENAVCPDCNGFLFQKGEFKKCACFMVLSDPVVDKNKNGLVTLSFNKDWDKDSIVALSDTLLRCFDDNKK